LPEQEGDDMAKHVKGGKPAKQTRQAYETDDFGAPVLGVVFKDGRDLLRWIEQNREWERTAKVNTPAALLHRIDRGRRWRVSMFEPFGPIPGERRPTEEQMLDGWLHQATDDGLVIPLEAKRSIAALRSWAFSAAAEQAETASTPQPTAEPSTKRATKGMTLAEANIEARKVLEKNPCIKRDELAHQVGCSGGTISKTPAWKAVKEKLRAGQTPKIHQMTDYDLDARPVDQPQPEELIDDLKREQKRDQMETARRSLPEQA
jgi:hypothetical protein